MARTDWRMEGLMDVMLRVFFPGSATRNERRDKRPECPTLTTSVVSRLVEIPPPLPALMDVAILKNTRLHHPTALAGGDNLPVSIHDTSSDATSPSTTTTTRTTCFPLTSTRERRLPFRVEQLHRDRQGKGVKGPILSATMPLLDAENLAESGQPGMPGTGGGSGRVGGWHSAAEPLVSSFAIDGQPLCP